MQTSYRTARTAACKFNAIRKQTAVAWHPAAEQGSVREKEKSAGEIFYLCRSFLRLLNPHWHMLSYISLCVQEDLEQLQLFHTQLEALEKQTQNFQRKLKAGLPDTDSAKVG